MKKSNPLPTTTIDMTGQWSIIKRFVAFIPIPMAEFAIRTTGTQTSLSFNNKN